MPHAIHWFRRDFRARDNAGLCAAARAAGREGSVTGLFVIDPRWWKADRAKLGAHQAAFWLASLRELERSLADRGIPLVIRHDADPVKAVLAVARACGAELITYNKEYEPAQREMDARLASLAGALRILPCKDAAVFEENDLLKPAGGEYRVFTPYKRAYLKLLDAAPLEVQGLPARVAGAASAHSDGIPSLASLGFRDVALDVPPGERAAMRMLEDFMERGIGKYAATRDLPALSLPGARPGTSRLSAHLNAGTISIRQVMTAVLGFLRTSGQTSEQKQSAETFLGELIWREFYRMILFHHPHTVTQAFQEAYRRVTWNNPPAHFAAWSEGRTGYPIVDAAMRQLLATGFMHNRLRMIAAMFLTKDLDTHWMLGERYFMRTLMDYDQAANVGGWQWSASTGTDAAPYFRVMNPVLQSERFDPEGAFIRHFVPELARVPAEYVHAPWEMPAEAQRQCGCVIGRDYPAPIVDHAVAKKKAVEKFRK